MTSLSAGLDLLTKQFSGELQKNRQELSENQLIRQSADDKIVSLAKAYAVDHVETAIRYCIRVKIFSLHEIQAYLLYRYGTGIGKRKLTENAFYHSKKRAEEIAEEQHGRLD